MLEFAFSFGKQNVLKGWTVQREKGCRIKRLSRTPSHALIYLSGKLNDHFYRKRFTQLVDVSSRI
jgi:hypothetical protein